MGAPYQSQSVSGYNSSPPPDDGSTTAANKISWATIKTKLADPLNTFAAAVNTALRSALNVSPSSTGVNYTTVKADHLTTVEFTGSSTISLGDAASMIADGVGYTVTALNKGTGTGTVNLITGTNTLAGQTNGTVTLMPGQSMTFTVAQSGVGYDITGAVGFAPFVLTGAAGTNTATANAPANLIALYAGLQVWWTPANANTGATTLAITPSGGSALTAKNVFVHGSACTGGELKNGVPLLLEYDGTQFNVIGGGLDGFASQSANTVLAGPSSGAAAAPTFRALVAADGATVVLLGSKTASASASISFVHLGGSGDVTFDWTAYDEYEFHFVQLVPGTNATVLQSQISEDSGATYKAGAAAYSNAWISWDIGTAVAKSALNASVFELTDTTLTLSNGTDGGVNGKLVINKPSSTIKKIVKWDTTFNDGANVPGTAIGGGFYNADTGAWTGIKFLMNSGTIASGTIYAYGIRKS